MLPATRLKFPPNALGIPNQHPPSARDLSNAGQRNPTTLWKPFALRNREQQFVIFPAMKRQIETY